VGENMESLELNAIKALYQKLIQTWNNRNAQEMADQFTAQGELIGFDGSQVIGRDNIFTHVQPQYLRIIQRRHSQVLLRIYAN